MSKLSLGPHDVVIGPFLPKWAAAAKQAVDTKSAAAFPILEDFAECFVLSGSECVKMIRHYNPDIEQRFCTKTTKEYVAHVGATKQALAAARIEPLMPCFGKRGVKLVRFVIGQCVDFARCLKAVRYKPSISSSFSCTELFLRHEVCKPGGDEVGDTGLRVTRLAKMRLWI